MCQALFESFDTVLVYKVTELDPGFGERKNLASQMYPKISYQEPPASICRIPEKI